ncbi:amidohydrolase [Carboxylicivirga mesophila]|uniref:Amidohydrolase n=1 Tax=Carboxylicivirga mesophila TaxID=1166478 RepID=A0ABS5KB05_9BACT|nr:amidohydrolase [Carboxylicivirga mesophila]MBS2212205.1 amidohydrolase [Carboxylicivirga mesophila]
MTNIIGLRQYLHQHPELSNQEFETAAYISKFIQELQPDAIYNSGSTGKIFLFKGSETGPTVVFRAELDALPIRETNILPYNSQTPGVAHLCGHDGHMAILAGLAQQIAKQRPLKGQVGLLFQPAEEVEQGARDVMESEAFRQLKPDYIFALHNIPGYPLHQVLVRPGSFSAASQGMTVKLTGKTSHAAEPENGLSPAGALARIIESMHLLREQNELFKNLILLTIIHIKLGEIAFGTSPGEAEIRITLRAFENADMDILTQEAISRIEKIAKDEQLTSEFSFSEVFPATVNHTECVRLIEQAAKDHNLEVSHLEQPFKWSEDFGYYTEHIKGGFFGLGSGVDQPALHNPDFNFPDDILSTGIKIFKSIYKKLNL